MHIKDFIEANITIDEVVRNFVLLWESTDSEFKTAHCPFHHDEDKTFVVNTTARSFYCFACKAAGDMFDFVSRLRKVDFLEACQTICTIMNTPMPDCDKNGKMSDEPVKTGLTLPPLLHMAIKKYCKDHKMHAYEYHAARAEEHLRPLNRFK